MWFTGNLLCEVFYPHYLLNHHHVLPNYMHNLQPKCFSYSKFETQFNCEVWIILQLYNLGCVHHHVFYLFIENIQCFLKKLMPYVYVLLFISSLQKQVWNFFIIWWCSNILTIYLIYVKFRMHCNSKVIQYDIELFIILSPHMVDLSN
jgi:hypothetical protein